jgi:hypothetical protein
VKMRMPAGVVAESLNGEDDAGNTLLLAQSHLQKGGETFGSTLAQFPQQLTRRVCPLL